MSEVFKDKVNFNEDLSNWEMGQVTDMQSMFEGATSFDGNLTYNGGYVWNVDSVVNMANAFKDAIAFTGKGLETWNANFQNVNDTSGMFNGATSFTDLTKVYHWNINNVLDADTMFDNSGVDSSLTLCVSNTWTPAWYATTDPILFGVQTCTNCTGHCKNGGVCDAFASQTCNCTGTGYEGDTCEDAFNYCNDTPCQHNGACTSNAAGYSCDCTNTGWTGLPARRRRRMQTVL